MQGIESVQSCCEQISCHGIRFFTMESCIGVLGSIEAAKCVNFKLDFSHVDSRQLQVGPVNAILCNSSKCSRAQSSRVCEDQVLFSRRVLGAHPATNYLIITDGLACVTD